ncbi:type II toxin-antitoxin system VapC family toxin [Dactylosporangium roseum]|uniref:Type II toxin-antitoxin system VapC family toxin n=1 Tax=Dactylosporangium roseum TaxID=47989 RepID=A0ABY5Z347_9ACTN|nr:type II toxin-antitoxin system VapC family toxin [Dactylosporangium roseum]UWZ35178.1 type II toxin-antitoxin system VapC family toxin [Dactylosporangium roseum]
MTGPAVGLVLDASAILAYTQGKADVDELVATVVADGGKVLVPAVALAETRSELAYSEELRRLDELLGEARVTVLSLDGADAAGLGRLAARLNGSIGLAHAVAEAQRHEARLLTAHGGTVRRNIGELDGIVDL